MWVYFIVLVVFFALYFLIPRKYVGISFVFLVIGLAVVAFYAEPNETDDLARYFRIIDQMRDGGWDRFQLMLDNNEFDFGSLPVAGYYFYFISLLPDNHYLPFFTILISYGCIMLVLYKAAQKYKVDKFYLFLSVFFMLSTYWFYDVYSGTRNGLAFSIAVACIYYHFVERKNLLFCFAGYFLVCGLHSSGIVIVMLAVVAWFTWQIASKFVNVLLIFGLVGGSVLIGFLASVTDNSFIQTVAEKTEIAIHGFAFATQTNFLVNVATYAVGIIVFAYCSPYIKKYTKNIGEKCFFRFAETVMFFMAGAVFSTVLFHRIARWVLPVVIAVIFMVGMQIQKNRMDSGKINISFFSDTAKSEKLRAQNKGITAFFIFVYALVHFWYDFTGSSLIWLHF